MEKFLVSFCNVDRAQLAVVTAEGIVRIVLLDLSRLNRRIVGLTGITFHQGQCVVAVQCTPSAIVELDTEFNVVAAHDIPDAADIHGIASRESEILLVSTGTNQILAFHPTTHAVCAVWSSKD